MGSEFLVHGCGQTEPGIGNPKPKLFQQIRHVWQQSQVPCTLHSR